jgi:hypothetical protein
MLASILVLICGFGVFAAFRVSRDPIAHLPVAAPPSQLLAETRAASSAVMVAGEIADQHSRFDIPVSALEETAAPTGTTERHDQAELVTESEQTAAPPPIAAMDTEASAAAEPEKEAAAMAPPERPPPPSTPVNDLPAPVQPAIAPPTPPPTQRPRPRLSDQSSRQQTHQPARVRQRPMRARPMRQRQARPRPPVKQRSLKRYL